MTRKYLLAFLLVQMSAVAIAQVPEDSLIYMERYFDLDFTPAQRDSLRDGLRDATIRFKAIHAYQLKNAIPPALVFRPAAHLASGDQKEIDWNLPTQVDLPENREELAYYSVEELSVLVKSRKITSTELTVIFLNRLKKFGDTLECVVTLTEQRALKMAKKADEEISSGNYRGPLHGIPYGIKDLFAVADYPTTWGAMPFKNQQIQEDATIVKKLDAAGAILVAKLTLGALAMGDVWFDGVTKNPWNLSQGSSGSSAGSASAVAAGLIPFAIGTETLGSIVSPSTRCGVTGLRPTFGRVSRSGGMALSWSMDKVGPIARSAKDCALVFDVIRGGDNLDPTIIESPFNYSGIKDLQDLKIGYLSGMNSRANDSLALMVFKDLGLNIEETTLPADVPVYPLTVILAGEAAAAFDELTRSGADSTMVRQDKGAWPNYFRTARFISAVDYINANRIRTNLMKEMNDLMDQYDVLITPSFGQQLVLTNLTGHPCLVLPNGFTENNSPTSFSLIGKLMGEASLISLGEAYQNATQYDKLHPEMFIP